MATGPPETPYAVSQLDQTIGSQLEAWLTRETGDYCRFCATVLVGDVEPEERFCSESCEEDYQLVRDARIAIGKRDLEQRGYD